MSIGNKRLRCGYLLPRILFLWLVLDLALHFAPPAWNVFQPQGIPMAVAPREGPFKANQTYQNSHAYGDLALMGNCVECRQYRFARIHIDSRGFPNLSASGPYDAVLVGDSFAVGLQQDTDSTLASQLSLRTGLDVYNASWPGHTISARLLLKLIDELGLNHGLVFYELMDRSLGQPNAVHLDNVEQIDAPDLLARLFQMENESLLPRISRELTGRLYDGRLLPNPYESRIIRKTLPDGRQILFYPGDTEDSGPDGPKLWAEYLQVLSTDLRQRGTKLEAILVPSKYTVYQPLLKDARKTDKSQRFDELQQMLSGITVVNTTARLQQSAADALKHGRLLYWLDDTHWNDEGVRVAADQIGAVYAANRPAPAIPKMESVSEHRTH